MITRRTRKCFFCQAKIEPDFKETETLKKFLSPRAKIISKDKTGTCSHHQKKLVREIKRARHLALLPFVA